jgi:hypothetical protein
MILRLSRQSAPYWIAVLLALGGFVYLAVSLNFVQDDAYISYRYVANYLNGDGLVFNVGERVEGFTNFGWVILMVFIGSLGLDYIIASQLLGFAMGAGIVILSLMMALRMLPERERLFAVLVPLLVGLNMSLAYWSPAGLETAAFAFMTVASLLLFLQRSWLLVLTLTWAVWLRPEGALITGLLIVCEAVICRRFPRFTVTAAAVALIASLPMVGFKLAYYGSILPNPFYAKTGFSAGQLESGLEYVGRFCAHYGFYGAGLVVPLLFWQRLGQPMRVVWLFTFLYTAYIVLVGGDVLQVHRFFLPFVAMYAVLHMVSLHLITTHWLRRVRLIAYTVVGLVLVVLTVWLPRDFVLQYNELERGFIRKMEFMATQLKQSDSSGFSVAIPTIGIFGYTLVGHDVVDLVGLTDSTIARHSEPPVPGLASTWKERSHNTRYLLQRAPDYIVFSTDIKPSAPAEQALLLYRPFREAYRSVGWYYQPDPQSRPGDGSLIVAHKKVRPLTGPLEPDYPVEFVQHYKRGIELSNAGSAAEALREFASARQYVEGEPYEQLLYQMGSLYMRAGQHDRAMELMNQAVAQDSMVFEAHKDLYLYARFFSDTVKAAVHETWVKQLAPWYWPRLDSLVEAEVAKARQRMQQSRGTSGR